MTRPHCLVIVLSALVLVLAACSPSEITSSPTPLAVLTPDRTASDRASRSCSATQFEATAYPGPGLSGIAWVRAVPATAEITAHLYRLQTAAPTQTQPVQVGHGKIFWQLKNPQAGDVLELTATNLTKGTMFHTTISRATSPADAYPSDIDFPIAGCWQLDLRSGTVAATVTFLVADRAGTPTTSATPSR